MFAKLAVFTSVSKRFKTLNSYSPFIKESYKTLRNVTKRFAVHSLSERQADYKQKKSGY